MIKNLSDTDVEWTDEDGRKFRELIRQEYTGNNCIFSGGTVEGCEVPEDVFYLRWEKDGVDPTMLLIRPDEAAAIGWLCTALLWSHTIAEMPEAME